MPKQAKVQLRPEQAWEYLAHFTFIAADKARRDRLSQPDHIHNTKAYPIITVTKTKTPQPDPGLGIGDLHPKESRSRRIQKGHWRGE